jgi:hydrogenase/urease accessory protein HupE
LKQMWRQLLATLLALACLALGTPAQADELRPGYLELTQTSERLWTVTFKAPVRGGMAANAVPVLPKICALTQERREPVDGSVVTRWRANCAGSLVGAKIALTGLDRTPSDALVRIALLDRPVQTARLTTASPSYKIAPRAGTLQVAHTYFLLGVEHILEGYDHLLFVLALVLLLPTGWVVARTVTAFTLAHSITLIGATLGFLGLDQKPVEICIALSIVFLAVEVVKSDPANPRLSQRFPWLVAFVFGLVHGFGFAGALAEIGMPEGEVPIALLTFNLGVEAGQLAIVLAGLGVLYAVGRLSDLILARFKHVAAYGIGITASFWLIVRMLA